MTKNSFLAGLFLLGISVTAFAKSNETVHNNISKEIKIADQSGGGSNGGTVLIPIKPPKPPVIIK